MAASSPPTFSNLLLKNSQRSFRGFELIVAAEADSFVALRALVESEAVAAVLPEGLVHTFSLERFARISAKELDSLRREIVVTCNARSASLRPAIHQATQQLASLWAP